MLPPTRHHNHPGSSNLRVHVAHRQRAARQTQASSATATCGLVSVQVVAGVTTAKIFAAIRFRDEGSLAIPKDISNAKSSARSKLLATRTSNKALFEVLKDNGFFYYYGINPHTSRVRYLVWAYSETTELARYIMDLMVLDCTYKANCYRMLLLNVVWTGMNTVLPFAQVWLPGEAEPDFTWAFGHLKQLMVVSSAPEPRVISTDRDLA
ncbi:unnamed protein product [Phytophthora fragariaefolia]|uniref:Unnamed protein product n=1 Tax=Phytophthora fragariaefolia TaxID=1490495 RepID=A0A9W6XRF8_9STRA|nr:unnamed protein product [Phytophthora fragariaefolia]